MTQPRPRRYAWLAAAALLAIPALFAAKAAKHRYEEWQRLRDLEVACAIIGDSIAQGLGAVMPACTTRAAPGAPSNAYNGRYPGSVTATAWIAVSLGTNDHLAHLSLDDTRTALETLRQRLHAPRIIWLSPVTAGPAVQDVVTGLARDHNDTTLDIAPETRLGKDGIHPSPLGYQRIAQRLPPLPQPALP